MAEETDLTFCGNKLEPRQLVELKYVGKLIGRGTTIENIEKSWSSFIETSLAELAKLESPDLPTDVSKLVHRVLSESYLVANEDVKYYSEKVKLLNELKEEIREELNKMRTKMEEYISCLEQNLETLGDDAQLANVDLQNALQKQQQTLQSMSNVSKMLHDTAIAVIRKIG